MLFCSSRLPLALKLQCGTQSYFSQEKAGSFAIEDVTDLEDEYPTEYDPANWGKRQTPKALVHEAETSLKLQVDSFLFAMAIASFSASLK